MHQAYPTMEQVNEADHTQICRWYRFLPSPGTSGISEEDLDRQNFAKALAAEAPILKRITERLKEFGGFTPEISKEVGWNR